MPFHTRRSILLTTGLAATAVGLGACTAGQTPDPADFEPATVPLDEIPVGGGVVLPDLPYVATQPTEGDFKAFTKTCTHQACPVSRIDEGEIVCDCHGSRYSITDGSVLQGPARDPLQSFPAAVDGQSLQING